MTRYERTFLLIAVSLISLLLVVFTTLLSLPLYATFSIAVATIGVNYVLYKVIT